MECACEGLTRDSTDLHEFAYAVFANLAKVMKEEFAPALPELVTHLITVIGTDEGQLEPAEEQEKVRCERRGGAAHCLVCLVPLEEENENNAVPKTCPITHLY
jgi:hypothetical protein